MTQDELFPLPPVVVHVDATYVEGSGWHVGVVSRLPGEEWSAARRTSYDRLTHAEMLDTIWSDVASRLLLT